MPGTTNVDLVQISPPTPSTATLSVVGNAATTGDLSGWGGLGIQAVGTPTGLTAVFEGTADGSNFISWPLNTSAGTPVTTISGAGFWSGSIVGLRSFRVRCTAITAGQVVITMKPAVSSTPAVTAVTVNNTNTGTNAAAGPIGGAPPLSGDYTAVNVGGTLQGVTGTQRGSQIPMSVQVLDASGNQVTTFGGSGGTASNVNSAIPSVATAVGFSDGTNLQLGRVFDTDSGAGTEWTQGVNLRGSNSGGSFELGTSTHPVRVDPTGTTPTPVTQSGTWNVGTVTTVTTVSAATVTGNVADAGTDSGNPVLIAGTYTTATPTYTNGQRARARVDASGNLLVNVAAGSGSNGAASNTGAAVPAQASYTGINVAGNNTGLTGLSLGSARAATVAIVDGSGNQVTTFGGSGGTSSNVGSAVPSAATAAGFSDGTNLQIGQVYNTKTGGGTEYTVGVNLRQVHAGGSVEAGITANPLRIDPTGTTTQPVSGTVTANAAQSGAWTVNQGGTWTVQPGNSANTTPWLVKEQVSTPVLAAALSNTPVTINASACVWTAYYILNPNTSTCYVQILDATSPSVGTTAPKWSIGVPAGAAANLAGLSITLTNAFKVAATQTATGGSAPAIPLDCNFSYRAG